MPAMLFILEYFLFSDDEDRQSLTLHEANSIIQYDLEYLFILIFIPHPLQIDYTDVLSLKFSLVLPLIQWTSYIIQCLHII